MSSVLESFIQIASHNQNRGKFWRWSEFFAQTGLTPSQYQAAYQKAQHNPADPLWYLTQSAKNYTPWALEHLIPNYSNPKKFELAFSLAGIAPDVVQTRLTPHWAHFLYNSAWYWHQKQMAKIIPWFLAIPGVKAVYMVSSAQMEVAQASSDIDLIFQCYPYTTCLVRLYVKSIFKLSRRDVHPFHLEIQLYGLKLLSKLAGQKLENRFKSAIQNVQTQIWKFKNRPGLKLDAGIFYESESSLRKIYGADPRQTAWLWNKLRIRTNIHNSIHEAIPSLYFLPESRIEKVLAGLWALLLWLCLPACLPLALIQYTWIKLKNGGNQNFWISLRGIGFIPRFYKDGYLVDYLDKN
jgi:hypothetical protein